MSSSTEAFEQMNHQHHQHAYQQQQQQQQRQQPPSQSQSQQQPMERVLYNLHYRCCTYALQTTSRRSRSYAEHTILILAVCCFGAVLLAHRTFVFYPPASSSSSSSSSTLSTSAAAAAAPSSPLSSLGNNQNNSNNNNNNIHNHRHHIPTQCLSSIPGFQSQSDVDVTHLLLLPDNEDDYSSNNNSSNNNRNSSYVRIQRPFHSNHQQQPYSQQDHERTCEQHPPTEEIMFSYAREKGYLLLSPEICSTHNIIVQYVYVSKQDIQCFGEPFVQRLVFYLLGPDTVMINWLLGTFYNTPPPPSPPLLPDDLRNTHSSGYIYNPRTRVMIDVNDYDSYRTHRGHPTRTTSSSLSSLSLSSSSSQWREHWFVRKLQQLVLKLMVVIKTSFLFFITTTLVSFTLRETQCRMLHFTHTLQYHVRNHRPVIHLVTTHVMENLIFVPIMVGMIFFLIECYRGDKFLAFMVLSLIWVCESFSVVRYETISVCVFVCFWNYV
jgi:Tumour-associated protein